MVIKDFYDDPDQNNIIQYAVGSVTKSKTVKEIINTIDDLIIEAHNLAYEKYKSEERKRGIPAISDYLRQNLTDRVNSKESAIKEVVKYFNEYDSFFLSLAQARKSRAGGTFEKILKGIFDATEIPYSYQAVVNGKPDFIIPGKDQYMQSPQDTLIITLKRTTRERWRQVATEGAKGFRFILATIDKKISQKSLDEMHDNQISLVIPQQIIDEKKVYQDSGIVYNFEWLFNKLIPNTLNLWEIL